MLIQYHTTFICNIWGQFYLSKLPTKQNDVSRYRLLITWIWKKENVNFGMERISADTVLMHWLPHQVNFMVFSVPMTFYRKKAKKYWCMSHLNSITTSILTSKTNYKLQLLLSNNSILNVRIKMVECLEFMKMLWN